MILEYYRIGYPAKYTESQNHPLSGWLLVSVASSLNYLKALTPRREQRWLLPPWV